MATPPARYAHQCGKKASYALLAGTLVWKRLANVRGVEDETHAMADHGNSPLTD